MGNHWHTGFYEFGDQPIGPMDQLRMERRIAASAGITDSSRVLDVGCGIGGPACLGLRHFCGARGSRATNSTTTHAREPRAPQNCRRETPMNDHDRNDSELRLAAERAALPFRLLEQMQIPSGYERSFKLLPGRLLANRYLLGVDLKDIDSEQLHTICHRMNMPDEFVQSLSEHLPEANLVFVGFENNPPHGTYKIYLKFWDRVKAEVQSTPTSLAPKLLHLGVKWDATDNTQRTIARYQCYPLLTTDGILQRMTDIYVGHEDCVSWKVATEIVTFAASRAEPGSFIYLEVLEEDGLRRSFDINLYSAMLTLKEIEPALIRLRNHFAIPTDSFDRLARLTHDKPLGHLSAGISQNGEEFATIYYEA